MIVIAITGASGVTLGYRLLCVLKNLNIETGLLISDAAKTIIDYELNHFTDEYIINPSDDQTRPEGGDYFKEIIFHLDNEKKLCICPQNAETDGYCDIWMEIGNNKNEFNGENHQVWWK